MKSINKGIVLSVIFFVFLLVSTPCIPAVEINIVRDEYETRLSENIDNNDKSIMKNIRDMVDEKNLKSSNLFKRLSLFFSKSDENDEDFAKQSIVFLDIILIVLFLYAIIKVVPNFFQNIYSLISSIVSSIALIVSSLSSLVLNIIVFTVESLINLLVNVGKIILKIVEIVGITVFSLVVGVIALIALIIYSIIYGVLKAVGFLWKGLETLIGLILDILRLVYEAIFQLANRNILK